MSFSKISVLTFACGALAQQGFKQPWERAYDHSQCTIGEEDDASNPDRIVQCSSKKRCYCPITGNLLCKSDETCADFNANEKLTGCILKKHCGSYGNFTPWGEGVQNILFSCPRLNNLAQIDPSFQKVQLQQQAPPLSQPNVQPPNTGPPPQTSGGNGGGTGQGINSGRRSGSGGGYGGNAQNNVNQPVIQNNYQSNQSQPAATIKQSSEKAYDHSQCTIAEEDDTSNPDRITSCASAKPCYCPITGKLLCKSGETCADFKMTGTDPMSMMEDQTWSQTLKEGCALKKHCGLQGNLLYPFTPYNQSIRNVQVTCPRLNNLALIDPQWLQRQQQQQQAINYSQQNLQQAQLQQAPPLPQPTAQVSQVKAREDSPCTIGEEDDTRNPERITKCSSQKPCYCPITGKFMCPANETCGHFNTNYYVTEKDALNTGCILKKHCGLYGKLGTGSGAFSTLFSCPRPDEKKAPAAAAVTPPPVPSFQQQQPSFAQPQNQQPTVNTTPEYSYSISQQQQSTPISCPPYQRYQQNLGQCAPAACDSRQIPLFDGSCYTCAIYKKPQQFTDSLGDYHACAQNFCYPGQIVKPDGTCTYCPSGLIVSNDARSCISQMQMQQPANGYSISVPQSAPQPMMQNYQPTINIQGNYAQNPPSSPPMMPPSPQPMMQQAGYQAPMLVCSELQRKINFNGGFACEDCPAYTRGDGRAACYAESCSSDQITTLVGTCKTCEVGTIPSATQRTCEDGSKCGRYKFLDPNGTCYSCAQGAIATPDGTSCEWEPVRSLNLVQEPQTNSIDQYMSEEEATQFYVNEKNGLLSLFQINP